MLHIWCNFVAFTSYVSLCFCRRQQLHRVPTSWWWPDADKLLPTGQWYIRMLQTTVCCICSTPYGYLTPSSPDLDFILVDGTVSGPVKQNKFVRFKRSRFWCEVLIHQSDRVKRERESEWSHSFFQRVVKWWNDLDQSQGLISQTELAWVWTLRSTCKRKRTNTHAHMYLCQ